MCGIVAYLGAREAAPILLSGLLRLEYRGYDSAGIAVADAKGNLQIRKKEGKVANCMELVKANPCPGTVGIAHTRWATHGPPCDRNSHPHTNAARTIAVVHNGIIENQSALRQRLIADGYVFESDTDTEVLAHLVDEVMKSTGLCFSQAVPQALKSCVGSYGVVFLCSDEPNTIVAAKNGSPLMLGIGEDEYFVGSDATPFVEHTKKVITIEDAEYIILRPDGYEIMTLDKQPVSKLITELEWDLDEIEKGGYDYFMFKEIMEQPISLSNCMRGRITGLDSKPRINLGGLRQDWNGKPVLELMRGAGRLIFVACGTSYHAALVGSHMIQELTKIPCEVEIASEFRYSNPILNSDDVLIAVSQSGETADTLAAITLAKRRGLLTIGIVNAVGSSISRETDAGVYLHAGPEIGVASTKAFTGQVIVLALLALKLGEETISDATMTKYVQELVKLPELIKGMLETHDTEFRRIAKTFRYAKNFIFLGRGINFPVALEGALKLKEISYIHAQGYPAAEVKHGLIALVDQNMPVLFIALKEDRNYESVLSCIREVVSRNASAVVITDHDDEELNRLCEYVIVIPTVSELLSPLITVIPMQALSYHIAVIRGCNVDKPRNLAKAVTVE